MGSISTKYEIASIDNLHSFIAQLARSEDVAVRTLARILYREGKENFTSDSGAYKGFLEGVVKGIVRNLKGVGRWLRRCGSWIRE